MSKSSNFQHFREEENPKGNKEIWESREMSYVVLMNAPVAQFPEVIQQREKRKHNERPLKI